MQRTLEALDTEYMTYRIVGYGLALRVATLIIRSQMPLPSDGRGYDLMAIRLLHGERFSPFWPPGVPYFLAFFHGVFGEGKLVARIPMLLVYFALSLLIVSFGKAISSRRAGNLAALAFAFYPSCVSYSVEPLTELPAATCFLAVVLLGTLVRDKASNIFAALTGLFLGSLTLVRPSSMLLVIFVPLVFLLKLKKISLAALALVSPLIMISLWEYKVYKMAGNFVYINDSNSMDFFLGNNPYTPIYSTWPGGQGEIGFPEKFTAMFKEIESKPPAVRAGMYRRIAFAHILSRPDLFVLRTLSRIRTYFAFPTFQAEGVAGYFRVRGARGLLATALMYLNACMYWLIMILALLFLFSWTSYLNTFHEILLAAGSILLYSLPYWLAFSNPRLHFPVFPLFGIFAAVFADDLIYGRGVQAFAPLALFPWRRYALWFALIFFFYIQIEWAWVMGRQV